jgi:hypothetical protein
MAFKPDLIDRGLTWSWFWFEFVGHHLIPVVAGITVRAT